MFFFFCAGGLKPQSDTIYRKDGVKFTATVTEITEQYIRYQTSPENSIRLAASKIQKVVFKDGSSERFNATVAAGESQDTLHDKIEKLGLELGKQFITCAIDDLAYSAPAIDWGVTQRDYFNPGYMIIVVKVFYQRDKEMNENQWVVFNIKLDEKSGNYKCSFKNSSSYKDQPFFVKCQRKIGNRQ